MTSTFLAHRQAPRPDPFQPVQTFSLDWWQYPLETNAFKRLPVITSNLRDVFALPNSENVWAVGDDGVIVHSEDSGETWEQQEVNWAVVTDSRLTQALPEQEQQQIDSAEAFDVRQQTLKSLRSKVALKEVNPALKQVNAPLQTPITSLVATSKTSPSLHSVHFVDASRGWSVGDTGTILMTSNGGATWQAQVSGTESRLSSVHFVNATTGWAVGGDPLKDDGIILMTSNGGATWQAQTSGITNYLTSVHFVNATTGWAVGSGGTILMTSNGGASWQAQASETTSYLYSVHFLDADTGWALGWGRRTILTTSNGGATWRAQTNGKGSWLYSVHFVNTTTGWAVGDSGTILTTSNGGATWQAQTSGITNYLTSVHFVNATTGWSVGSGGTILMTSNGGATWKAQTSGMRSRLESVHFVNATTGWAVGGGGTILMTSNGGATWQTQTSGMRSRLKSVHFVNATTGWAVGEDGTILVTSNGGATWLTQASGTTDFLFSIHFVNATTGWAVGGGGGTILMTSNGGATWLAQTSRTESRLESVHFVNATTGWAVGSGGTILMTSNGGATWLAQASGTTNNLSSVHFMNATTGWAAGENGTIITTSNGGETWQAQASGTTSRLESVHFVNSTTGWAVGDDGTILVTSNGGASWQAQASGTTSSFSSCHFVNGTTGWAVGQYGTILQTTDSGQNWEAPALPNRLSFAPWYYLTWLFISPLLYLAFKKPKPIEAEQKTVADMLVSDRPISEGDPDPLEFNSIARGLSRFLRNENTQPPLTIAITGEWGSGKSSLINLLKANLERYGFRPVWFNAWHHQKEEHLLAALLQNIRKQALPRWWRREGMGFRARLFWSRVRRYRLLALLLLAGFAVAVGYFAADHPNRLHEAVQQIEHFFKGEKTSEDKILGWLQHKLAALGNTSVLALLGSVGAVLLMLGRGLRAFGVNPANLMASLSSDFKLSEVKAQMGFRHDFAREFSEVTAALNPRTMLILIDDLDRCRPENVLEVLEAVNFLVSSGECFVVMGLDLHRVERCVGLGFKDVAEELVDQTSPTTDSEKEEAKSRRAEFARQYLEKLINIEAPVPQPRLEQSQRLIVPPEPIAPAALPWWLNLPRMASSIAPKILPVILVVAAVIGGFWFGLKQFSTKSRMPSETTVAQSTTPTPSPTTSQPASSTPSTPPTRRNVPADSSRGTGQLIQPAKEPTSFTPVYVVLGIMLLLGVWRLSIPTDLVVKDSPEFIDALKIWHPLLIAKRNTPRSVKRFVNRVRYIAMRQSVETEANIMWQRLLKWTEQKWGMLQQEQKTNEEKPLAESILVALSAIQHYDAKLLKREHFRQKPESDVALLSMIGDMPPETHAAIQTAIDEHNKRFSNWPPSAEDYEKVYKIAADIRVI